jgi:hypothetical protein
MNDGGFGNFNKTSIQPVRPIRAFGGTATIPATPSIGVARALNSNSATITFITPATNGGSGSVTYTATSSPGSITGSITSAGSGTITVTGLSAGTSYTFTVTATNSAGTSAPSSASNSVNTLYFLGGTGPGGGIIFYDAGSVQSWGRYLEVAPKTWYGGTSDPRMVWSRNTSTSVATNTTLGSGSANTDAIITLDSAPGYAAVAARAYAGVGGSTLGQWFLPSKDELNLLCSYFTGQPQDLNGNYFNACSGNAATGRSGASGFFIDYYWSSSQTSATAAWAEYMNDGGFGNFNKTSIQPVRPIRAFL